MKKLVLIIVISVFLFGCSPLSKQSSAPGLSEKTLGWGFRRTDNGPEFTKEQESMMKKYKCIYRESTTKKVIYLTFDEGYENGYTAIILDTLKEKGVPAAFFVTAPYVKENPDLIKRMAKEGHIVGNHTVNHPSLPSVTDSEKFSSELIDLERLVFGVCGKSTKFLRPPKGEYSEKSLVLSLEMGYTNVFWSDAYVDWNDDVSEKEAHDKVTKSFHPGEVLLLHAVSKGNAYALDDIIDTARKNGYVFKSLEEYPLN